MEDPGRSFEKDLPGHHWTPKNTGIFWGYSGVLWDPRRSFLKDLQEPHWTPKNTYIFLGIFRCSVGSLKIFLKRSSEVP
jgi:hypothetical protein